MKVYGSGLPDFCFQKWEWLHISMSNRMTSTWILQGCKIYAPYSNHQNQTLGGFANPSISASTATGFLVVVAFMSAFVPRLVTCAGSGASRATWTLGMDVPFVPFVPPKSHWGCFNLREWGTCKTSRKEHPNKQHFLRKNMNHVTMSKSCVQNNFLPHLACFKFGNCVKKSYPGLLSFETSNKNGKQTYCWWKKSCTSWGKGSFSHYLQGFLDPRWWTPDFFHQPYHSWRIVKLSWITSFSLELGGREKDSPRTCRIPNRSRDNTKT